MNNFISETDSFVSRSILISKTVQDIYPSSRAYSLCNYFKYPMLVNLINGSLLECYSIYIKVDSNDLDRILGKSGESFYSHNKFKLLGAEDLPKKILIYSHSKDMAFSKIELVK